MKPTLLVPCLFFMLSCSEQKDPKLVEAAKLHNEATAIQASIEAQVEGIDSLLTILAEKKKTMVDANAIAKLDSAAGSLRAVSAAMEEWEGNLIEVPGMPHEHATGEHHHHEHKPAPDMSAEQMLQVQQETKKGIEAIKEDLAKAEEKLKNVF